MLGTGNGKQKARRAARDGERWKDGERKSEKEKERERGAELVARGTGEALYEVWVLAERLMKI